MDLEKQITELNNRLAKIEQNLGGLSNDPRQQEVIKNALGTVGIKVKKFGLDKEPQGRQANISSPTGGVTIDSEARSKIGQIITTLDAFGFTA